MIDLFQARRESHEARELGHEFKIQEGGVSLEVPRVEGQAFYPSGDAPRMTRDGTPMENIKEGLADLPKAVGSAGAGLAAGAAGLPGDLVGLAGGLAKFMFPGDQGRIEAAAETLNKISETAGSEFFLGLYRDFVNNSDASLEDKQMMLDVAEGASFGSIPGAGAVAKGSADTIRSGVVKAGEAAQARLDEATGSTTLTSGVDVGKGIDQAIAAAGRQFADAQVRYFETGKFEPPTAENPVSVVRPTETKPGIIAFHGSGADFDEFRLEMIGTGEGAQAYGYGLYFTDSEDIAKFYKNMMTRSVDIDGRPYIRGNNINDELVDPDIADDLGATNGDLEAAIKNSEEFLQEMIQADNVEAIRSTSKELEKLQKLRGRITVNDKGGKMYKVGLSPKPDDLLDYDGPPSDDVKAKVLQALKGKFEPVEFPSGEYGIRYFNENVGAERNVVNVTFGTRKGAERLLNATGAEILNIAEAIAGGRRQGAALLNDAGIPGIKYRAAGSRGAATTDEAAERNYVIFDDKAVKILEKYGIAGPVAITAAAAGRSSDNEDGGI